MKIKRILIQTVCVLTVAVLLCGCSAVPHESETESTETSWTNETETPETSLTGESEMTENHDTESVEDIIAGYGEWFLSPITYTAELRAAQIAEEYADWLVKTPKQVNVTRGELDITVDFFRSNHRLDESMQVRVTVRNTSDEPFLYRRMECYTINWQEDGSGFMGVWTKFREEQTYSTSLKEMAPHSEAVFEYLFVSRAGAYIPKGNLILKFYPIRPGNGSEGIDYGLSIPLEVAAN